MMINRLMIGAAMIAMMCTPAASAQQTKPAEPQKETARDPGLIRDEPPRPARNISFEFTITDQGGTAEPAKKVVNMIVADGRRGSVRSAGSSRSATEGRMAVTLNVDTRANVLSNGGILTELTIEYIPKPDPNDEAKDAPRSQLNQSLALVLESGKPTVVSQSADPVSNRKITVEVKATVLK
jgi:hypothetical protein